MSSAIRLSYNILRATNGLLDVNLLFCHGLFGSKQNWKSICNALYKRTGATLCMVDLRNHGYSPHSHDMTYLSMVKDLNLVVDDLQLRNVGLLGHSMGGKAVMCAALLYPDAFKRLIVVDSSPSHTTPAYRIIPYLQLMRKTDLYMTERHCDGTLYGMRQELMKAWKDAVPSETMRQFLLSNLDQSGNDFIWRVNLDAIEECWPHIVGFPNKELEGCTYNGPTLFIAGAQAEYLNRSHLPEIRKYFPNSRLLAVTNAGHWVHTDQPHIVLNMLASFLSDPDSLHPLEGVEDWSN